MSGRSCPAPTSPFTWSRVVRTALAVGGGEPDSEGVEGSRRAVKRSPASGWSHIGLHPGCPSGGRRGTQVVQDPPAVPAGIVESPDGNGQRGHEYGQAIDSVEQMDIGTGHDSSVYEIEDDADNGANEGEHPKLRSAGASVEIRVLL